MLSKYRYECFFAIICLFVSFFINQYLAPTMPGEWYFELKKSIFHPPGYVFSPVWTYLYLSMGAGFGYMYRDFTKYTAEIGLFVSQFIFNLAWSPIFFTYQRMDIALMLLTVIWGLVFTLVLRTYRNKCLAWYFSPYLLWLSYAWLLNASLIYINT